jgi:hypothetical protein
VSPRGCLGTPLLQLEFLEYNFETSCLNFVGTLEAKWDTLKDYNVEKGLYSLGLCKSREMIVWFELLQEFGALEKPFLVLIMIPSWIR